MRDEIDFGLKPGGELEVQTTICHEIRQSGRAVVIDEVATDAAFCGHPTPARYGFQSYISVPIRRGRDGDFFGTLCAIDPRPARLSDPATVGMFRLFADLIGFHLEAQERLAKSEAALLDARGSAVLREQFIAVLGHDLRNPLASIEAGASLLRRADLDPRSATTVGLIQGSVRRMSRLIDNVLDFARGRLGGGFPLERTADAPLAPVLELVLAELRVAWPDRTIQANIDLPDRVDCDHARIAQLLSNLVANGLTHGSPDEPVRVDAAVASRRLIIAVSNGGDPIPEEVAKNLFQPFFRASARRRHQGLGLGLYIAAEIARSHGGTLDVSSNAEETRFVLDIPLG